MTRFTIDNVKRIFAITKGLPKYPEFKGWETTDFDVLVIQEMVNNETAYCAQLLSVDIAAQGPTINEALKRLELTIYADIKECEGRGGGIVEVIGPPPAKFQKEFDKPTSIFWHTTVGDFNFTYHVVQW